MTAAHGEEKMYPDTLNVMSLNCWGLKFLSAHRSARLAQIGREIAATTPKPDIVALQECWTQADYQSIRSLTSDILPYGKYYHSGIFGGGLVIMSRFPFEESNMYQYPLNGRPTAFFRGDWYVGKGVASASLRVGPDEQDIVEVLNTHLHAPYEREPNDSYICHRTSQAWEIAKLARAAKLKGRTVLALGDFNMIPSSLAHQIVTIHGGLSDVWRVLHPDSSVGAAEDATELSRGRDIPNIAFNLSQNGTTCDSLANTWRMSKENQKRVRKREMVNVDMSEPDVRGKRLDYIFLAGAHRHRSWTILSARVGMAMRHPELKCSLSDHFSIEAELDLSPEANKNLDEARIDGPSERHNLKNASQHSHLLRYSAYTEIQRILRKYITRERHQRRLRLAHFVSSIIVSISCLAAVWWSPHNYVSFILMLLSTIGLTVGTIDGMIGGLFVGSELRALKEFEWEVANAKALVGSEN